MEGKCSKCKRLANWLLNGKCYLHVSGSELNAYNQGLDEGLKDKTKKTKG